MLQRMLRRGSAILKVSKKFLTKRVKLSDQKNCRLIESKASKYNPTDFNWIPGLVLLPKLAHLIKMLK
jgi:hypothetical protein